MVVLTTADFTEAYKVSLNEFNTDKFEQYISDDLQKDFLYRLLGKTMADTYITEVSGNNGVPTSAELVTIHNPIRTELDNCLIISAGIKGIMVKWFYGVYTKRQPTFNQTTGNTKLQVEASSADNLKSYVIANECVDDIRELRRFILKNPTDYPDFRNYECFEYQSFV